MPALQKPLLGQTGHPDNNQSGREGGSSGALQEIGKRQAKGEENYGIIQTRENFQSLYDSDPVAPANASRLLRLIAPASPGPIDYAGVNTPDWLRKSIYEWPIPPAPPPTAAPSTKSGESRMLDMLEGMLHMIVDGKETMAEVKKILNDLSGRVSHMEAKVANALASSDKAQIVADGVARTLPPMLRQMTDVEAQLEGLATSDSVHARLDGLETELGQLQRDRHNHWGYLWPVYPDDDDFDPRLN